MKLFVILTYEYIRKKRIIPCFALTHPYTTPLFFFSFLNKGRCFISLFITPKGGSNPAGSYPNLFPDLHSYNHN